jgi:hypothetical protein
MKHELNKMTANGMSKSCLGKARFPEHKAQQRAKKYDQRAYYCGLCQGWHLTKQKANPNPIPLYHKDAEIYCPTCKELYCVIATDIFSGTHLSASALRQDIGQVPFLSGTRIECKCGQPMFDHISGRFITA